MPRIAPRLNLTADEKKQLEAITRSHSAEQRMVLRSKIVLGCAEGRRVNELARDLNVVPNTIAKWRDRFCQFRLSGLADSARQGRRVFYDNNVRTRILKKLEESPSDGLARWDGPIQRTPLHLAQARGQGQSDPRYTHEFM